MGSAESLDNLDNSKDSTKIWKGPTIEPLYNPKISVGQAILYALTKNEYKVLQISDTSGIKSTGLDLKLKTIAMAKFLLKNGFKQGDVIGLSCKNSDNFAPIVFGAFLIGTPISPLDTELKKEDIVYVFRRTQPKIVFCDAGSFSEVQDALNEIQSQATIYTVNNELSGIPHVDRIFIENKSYDEFIPPKLENPVEWPAAILCSSGTTGPIKAVAISHAAILNQEVNAYLIKSSDVFFNPNSIYWISALWTLVVGTLKGATRIISETFSPEHLANLIEKYKLTVVLTPTFSLQALKFEGHNLNSMRLYQGVGAPISEPQKIKINSYSETAYLYVAYGLTEIGGVVNDYSPNTPANSVGRVDANFQMKILNEAGKCLDAEQPGEICIKCIYPFLGYYANPEKTCQAIDSEGWFHSGDIGYFDKDGWLFLVARKGENFRTLGFRIVPREIEEMILELPSVSAVCVCGVLDPDWKDRFPAAAVVIKAGYAIEEQEIIDYVAGKVPNYKKLTGGVYFLNELPRTSTGKVKRRPVLEFVQNSYDSVKEGPYVTHL